MFEYAININKEVLLLQDEVVQAFIVSKDGLEKMSQLLLKQMEVGLAKENHGGELLMLITYVHDLPDGKETGDFLALDLGRLDTNHNTIKSLREANLSGCTTWTKCASLNDFNFIVYLCSVIP